MDFLKKIDFDSTVITRSGNQQGCARGYNPNRRGRNSHHPFSGFYQPDAHGRQRMATPWQYCCKQ